MPSSEQRELGGVETREAERMKKTMVNTSVPPMVTSEEAELNVEQGAVVQKHVEWKFTVSPA